jgi:RNA polymerase sigma-70 factor (ECF subfamily)
MEKTDTQLVQEYLQGDLGAYTHLMNRYMEMIYSFVYRFVYDEMRAQDITQEVFIKVWRYMHKYDVAYSFKTWIFTIARRTALDELKKRKIFTFSELQEEDTNSFEETLIDTTQLPDVYLDEKFAREHLQKAINQLPIQYKTVVLLRCDGELTFEEIGEVMKLPMNTVKSQYRRAIEKLRVYLK